MMRWVFLDEAAARALFPKFETQIAVAGPTPEARFAHHPPTSLTDVTEGSHCWFCGELGIGVGASVNVVLPVYTFGKFSAGKAAIRSVPVRRPRISSAAAVMPFAGSRLPK